MLCLCAFPSATLVPFTTAKRARTSKFTKLHYMHLLQVATHTHTHTQAHIHGMTRIHKFIIPLMRERE